MYTTHLALLLVCLIVLTVYAVDFPEDFDRTDEILLLCATTLSGYAFYVCLLFYFGVML